MQFEYESHKCSLNGVVLGGLQLLSGYQLSKCLQMNATIPYFMLCTSDQQIALSLLPVPIREDLQQLLLEFQDLFRVSRGYLQIDYKTTKFPYKIRLRW